MLTGLRIEPDELQAVDRVETRLRALLPGVDLRCRRLAEGYNLEIATEALAGMTPQETEAVRAVAVTALGHEARLLGISSYRRGSAFVR